MRPGKGDHLDSRFRWLGWAVYLVTTLNLLVAIPLMSTAQQPGGSTLQGEWHYMGGDAYHLKKLEQGPRKDGRVEQPTALDDYGEAVEAIQPALDDGRLTGGGRAAQARQIYGLLIRDHGYGGSYPAVVRHMRRKHGRPRLRALRRVETPPGVQAQHD